MRKFDEVPFSNVWLKRYDMIVKIRLQSGKVYKRTYRIDRYKTWANQWTEVLDKAKKEFTDWESVTLHSINMKVVR